jgi:phosphoribosyl-AMP cyclohydrolase / phosphoribosyl-ATP pyrophosphohydrolase
VNATIDLSALDFEKAGGLVTVVAVDVTDGAVLMVAHADREALERTISSGEMHYRSRSRGPWHKGATSGNVQEVVSLTQDCDGDAVLAIVRSRGPACHTGLRSCFGDDVAQGVLSRLDAMIARRAIDGDPATSHTAALLADRNLRLKKLGEESTELAVAIVDGNPVEVTDEAADLLFHLLVAVRAAGVTLLDVLSALQGRERDA